MVALHRCEVREGSAAKFKPPRPYRPHCPPTGVHGRKLHQFAIAILTHQAFALRQAHFPGCFRPAKIPLPIPPVVDTKASVAGQQIWPPLENETALGVTSVTVELVAQAVAVDESPNKRHPLLPTASWTQASPTRLGCFLPPQPKTWRSARRQMRLSPVLTAACPRTSQ